MFHAEGSNGSVTLDGDRLKIRHKGLANFLTAGAHGEKVIPIANITAVQFKEAGIMAGYIQLSIVGGVDRGGGVMAATKDENAVLFTHDQQTAFSDMRDAVERLMAQAKAPPMTIGQGVGDLEKLVAMLERGFLTAEEFQAAKRKLLGM